MIFPRFNEFGQLDCVNGAGDCDEFGLIWVCWLDWVHCFSFFLLVVDLTLFFVFIWSGFEFLVIGFDLEITLRTSYNVLTKNNEK